MEGYASDQEQVEAIKRWWRTNGKAILLGVIVGASIIVGWRLWSNHQATQAELASIEYEQVLIDMRRGDNKAALDRGARLVEQQRDTPYAALAALALAKIKVEDKDQQGARYYLQWVADNAKQPALKDIARLRLARVMLADGEAAAALDALKEVDMEAYGVPAQEIKGDILVALNRLDEARSAYRSAIKATTGPGEDQDRLQMKLSAIGGAEAS